MLYWHLGGVILIFLLIFWYSFGKKHQLLVKSETCWYIITNNVIWKKKKNESEELENLEAGEMSQLGKELAI